MLKFNDSYQCASKYKRVNERERERKTQIWKLVPCKMSMKLKWETILSACIHMVELSTMIYIKLKGIVKTRKAVYTEISSIVRIEVCSKCPSLQRLRLNFVHFRPKSAYTANVAELKGFESNARTKHYAYIKCKWMKSHEIVNWNVSIISVGL